MISVLSRPMSGRRIGSVTASSSAVMAQPPGQRLAGLEHQPPLRHDLQPARSGGRQLLLRPPERDDEQP
jgi:hypothetical protein